MEDIVLLGPKHSGKTSAGRELAALWDCDFIDLDELIERREGKPPRALYAAGPEVFMRAEAEAAASLAQTGGARRRVIAAGGGITDNENALTPVLKEAGALGVYLEVSANTAWARITADPSGELPLFLRTGNPCETHRALHERRAASCRRLADIIIAAEDKTPREIAQEIASRALPGGRGAYYLKGLSG
jgi:shikimate kinase